MARRGRQPSSSAGPPAPFQPTSAGLGGIKAVFTREAFDSSSSQRPPSTSSLWPPSVVRSPGAPACDCASQVWWFLRIEGQTLHPQKDRDSLYTARLALSRGLEPTPRYLWGGPGVGMLGTLVSGEKPSQNSRGEG